MEGREGDRGGRREGRVLPYLGSSKKSWLLLPQHSLVISVVGRAGSRDIASPAVPVTLPASPFSKILDLPMCSPFGVLGILP